MFFYLSGFSSQAKIENKQQMNIKVQTKVENKNKNQKEQPKVSVIVPVYNVEKWLPECMDSLINQTLKEIEIICVDDGSTDNSGKILDEYAKKDTRIKVIHQKNKGLSGARNTGLDFVTGEYTGFVDSDDYVHLLTYEYAYKYAKQDDVDMLRFGYRRFRDGKDNFNLDNIDLSDGKLVEGKITDFGDGSCWCHLYRSELIKERKLHFVDNSKIYAEDCCFNCMFLAHVTKYKVIPGIFYNYRRNRINSLSYISNLDNQFKRMAAIPKYVIDYWKSTTNFSDQESSRLLDILISNFFCKGKDRLKYSKIYSNQILTSLGEIYNQKVIKLCSKQTQDYIKLLEKCSKSSIDDIEVDVVYKYIDLYDPNLKHEGKNRKLNKDYHNNELKYSLRSVLKNIPWVRKIFIIMPNDKVSFLKDISEISDKIVYIKDKDFLGFDSCKCEAFMWKFWELAKYGCSNNIICFDDDCFIGTPMKKSDFFYKDENGKIIPYVFFDRNKISKLKKSFINDQLNKYRAKVSPEDEKKQGNPQWIAQLYSGYRFLYDVLKKDILLISNSPAHALHNAKPMTLEEAKFLYNIVNKDYEFKDQTFNGKYRSKYDILIKPFYDFYYLNSENRKINDKVKYKTFNLKDRKIVEKIKENKYKLFCINTGGVEYSDKDRLYTKRVMEELFPEKTIYEKNDAENSSLNRKNTRDATKNKKKNGRKADINKKNIKTAK